MGKVQQGILDGFIGKVGTVVGSFWKGKPVMRGYKRVVRDANSEAQELIRTRFAALGALAGNFVYALRLGFKNVARAKKLTEGDVFVRLNWDHVHAAIPGTPTIDYADLVVAKGNLPKPDLETPDFTGPLAVKVAQNDTSSQIGASADDMVYLLLYNTDARAAIMSEPISRTEAEIIVEVPDYWNGSRVSVWGFAIGGASENEGVACDSLYLGQGEIQ